MPKSREASCQRDRRPDAASIVRRSRGLRSVAMLDALAVPPAARPFE
jgi:hypothetical protein